MSDPSPTFTSTSRGLLIVLEGLDRSGKSTQCSLLHSALLAAGHRAKLLRFPDRSTATGKIISEYLSAPAGSGSGPALSDHAIHLLFSANRWEAAPGMLADLAAGTTLIVDRYAYSGAVYSAAKRNRELGLEWAWGPEVGLPRPDLVVYLTVGEEVQQARGGFGEERYEKVEMQREVRRLFGELFDELSVDKSVGGREGDLHWMRFSTVNAEDTMVEVQRMVRHEVDSVMGQQGRRMAGVEKLVPFKR